MITNHIRSVYKALRDEESRYIFMHRFMYVLNDDDIREIYKIIEYKMKMANGEVLYNNSNSLVRLVLDNSDTEKLVYILVLNRIGELIYEY